MSSKFLSSASAFNVASLQDGSTPIAVASATVQNLVPNFPVVTDSDRRLVSSLLGISDTSGLQEALTAKPLLDFVEGLAPANPPGGALRLYAKGDGRMYYRDEVGVEFMLATGEVLKDTWLFDDLTTSGDPGTGRFRMNTESPSAATAVYLSSHTTGGGDMSPLIGTLRQGDQVYFCTSDQMNCKLYDVSGALSNNGTYWTIPVVLEGENNTFQFDTDDPIMFRILPQSNDLQSAYSISASPQITTSASAGGPLVIQRGTATDTDTVLAISNGSGVQVASITGEGELSVADVRTTMGSIHLGGEAGLTSQGLNAVAIGLSAGKVSQGVGSVALGRQAGENDQPDFSIAIGDSAGKTSQGSGSIAIGVSCGTITQGDSSVALGPLCGYENQGNQCVAIGSSSAASGQGDFCVAVGALTAVGGQTAGATAIGHSAGASSQGGNAVAAGYKAGMTSQGGSAVAMGHLAGTSNQKELAVAIGRQAGSVDQGIQAVAVGHLSGETGQLNFAVAVGMGAGRTAQGPSTVAVGHQAGNANQGANTVAVGNWAGLSDQLSSAVAVGTNAGQNSQGINSVAVGSLAGNANQGGNAVAIGPFAGQTNQFDNAVAIGNSAAPVNQGADAVAIGAGSGGVNQAPSSIALGVNSSAPTRGFFIGPTCIANKTGSNRLNYNPTSGEISQVVASQTVFKGNAGATQTVYEDAEVRLIWDGVNAQPKFLIKVLPVGLWVDAGIELRKVGRLKTNSDAITNVAGVEYYFTGALNTGFQFVNYGSKATTWLVAETDSLYPTYGCEWICGDTSGNLVVVINRY